MKNKVLSTLIVSVLMVCLSIIAMGNSADYGRCAEAKNVSKEVVSELPLVRFQISQEIREVSEEAAKKAAQKVEEEKKAEAERREKERLEKEKKKWKGEVLTASKGVVQGPNGKETYYNLNMSGVVKIMRKMGYSEEEYPYSVREDGVKMLGPYVMCAANLNIRPRGSLIETSLGTAIVCDTGGFAKKNPKQIDIAVSW